jgi:hypothetical protein
LGDDESQTGAMPRWVKRWAAPTAVFVLNGANINKTDEMTMDRILNRQKNYDLLICEGFL